MKLITFVCFLAAPLFLNGAFCRAQDNLPEWVHRIRSDHPRLFFNADTLPAARHRALTVEREFYERVKHHADNTEPRRGWWGDRYGDPDMIPVPPPRPGSEVDARDWGFHALSSAVVYMVEPTPERLKRIRDMLWASLDYYHACYEAKRSVSWYVWTRISWLAAMDLVWNDLEPAERAEMGRSILRHADDVLNKPDIARRSAGTFTVGYYGGRNMTLFAGLLFHNAGIDDEAALGFLLEGWRVYERLMPHRANMAGDDGGGASPTITYSLADYPYAEWHLIYALRSAAGADIAAEYPHIAMLANYVYWNYLPGGLEHGYGDVPHLTNRFRAGFIYTHLSNVMNLYADTRPKWSAVTAAVRNMVGGRYLASGRMPFPLMRSEAYDAVEAVPLEELQKHLPMARHFENMGQTFMRSGHGPDDTYAMFSAGGITRSHKHYDETHFIIYKKGFLALDTGARQGAHLANYYAHTIAHNCVLIYMPGEEPVSVFGAIRDQAGGQNRQTGAEVTAFETNPYYSYVAADATPVYHEDKCAMMARQFIFVPPDHFVVFDRVISKDAGYEKTWLLHHANEPVFEGRTWRSDQDRGRIFAKTLLPEDAAIKPVGGPGREFLVKGVNYPISESLLRNGEVPELMGRWRVEVSPGAAREEDVFLHVLQAGGSELEKMEEARLAGVRDGEVEAVFHAHGREVTLRLNTAGDVGGRIRITGGGEVLLDRALTEEVQPQEGLGIFE